MASTATTYISAINTAFPVAGVDNDTQGFRDNYINIRLGMQSLANEVEALQADPVSQISALTLTNVNVTGTVVTSNLTVNDFNFVVSNTGTFEIPTLVTSKVKLETSDKTTSSTITLSDNRVIFSNAKSILLSDSTYVSSSTLVSWAGAGATLSLNTLTVSSVVGINVGYTFKFYNTETANHTVLGVNPSTNQITTDPFDPADIEPYTDDPVTVTFTSASVIGNYAGSAPSTLAGAAGDKRGMFFADSAYVYVCVQDYISGQEEIWIKFRNVTPLTLGIFAAGAPASSIGQAGDKKGMFFVDNDFIHVCTADYTTGGSSIWATLKHSDTAHYATVIPFSSKGAAGDKKGMFIANTQYLYVCTADYTTGASDIWVRIAVTGTTW